MFKPSSDGGASASASEGAHDIAGTSPSWRCGGFATRCDAMRRDAMGRRRRRRGLARGLRAARIRTKNLRRAPRAGAGAARARRGARTRAVSSRRARAARLETSARRGSGRGARRPRERERARRDDAREEEMKRTRASVTDGLRALARDAGSTRARFRGYCGTRRAPRARARRTTSCGARRR